MAIIGVVVSLRTGKIGRNKINHSCSMKNRKTKKISIIASPVPNMSIIICYTIINPSNTAVNSRIMVFENKIQHVYSKTCDRND